MRRELKRKIIQIAAFGYSNPHLANFAGGRVYDGSRKQLCNPGMNCYSCPAAGLACPVGAMQAGANSAECIRCGKCITSCPEDALSAGFRINSK